MKSYVTSVKARAAAQAAAPPAGRSGEEGRGTKTRRGTGTEKGSSLGGRNPRPPRSPKPRARATDDRAEQRREEGSRSGPKGREAGGEETQATSRSRRPTMRTKRTGPREPPRQGAKGAAVRKKGGGPMGRRPGGGTVQAHGRPEPCGRGCPSAAARSRKLGDGIDAASSANAGPVFARHLRQRTGTTPQGLHPWVTLSVADIAGVAPGGSTPAWYRRAPATHQQRGFAPAQQPQRATGLLNGVPVRTSLVCRSFVRAQPSFT